MAMSQTRLEGTVGLGDEAIAFSLRRSRRRRTVALRVDPSGEVIVYAPHFVLNFVIDGFVRKQREWIEKKRAFFKSQPAAPPVTAERRAEFARETEARLPAMIARNADRLGVTPQTVKVADQTQRWASCSSRGILRFSWRMARLPEEVFEYIVVHELSHLRHMNHSPRFWAAVQSVCPEFKSHRRWLRKNGAFPRLFVPWPSS
jgi:hypothetical protein